jgi:hypothetical protein
MVTFKVVKNTSKHITFEVERTGRFAGSAKVRFPVDEFNDPSWYKPYVLKNELGTAKNLCQAIEDLYTSNFI